MVSESRKRIRGIGFAIRVLLKALCSLAETAQEAAGTRVCFPCSQVRTGWVGALEADASHLIHVLAYAGEQFLDAV